MDATATTRFSQCRSAGEALRSLCGGLQAREVAPHQMPADARALLAHHGHMTEVLGQHYREPVRLTVLQDQLADGVYWRKILLRGGRTGRLLECGIVRLFLEFVPKAACDEILSRRTPLGAVLIAHHVLRRVEPRWYVSVAGAEIRAQFGVDVPLPHVHGRIGVIYCSGEPAIELLEVVPE